MSMVCSCGRKTSIVDSRLVEPQVVRRRHHCSCGAAFTTRERVENTRGTGKMIITQTEIETLQRIQAKILAVAGQTK